jgi:hypothetical protein
VSTAATLERPQERAARPSALRGFAGVFVAGLLDPHRTRPITRPTLRVAGAIALSLLAISGTVALVDAVFDDRLIVYERGRSLFVS